MAYRKPAPIPPDLLEAIVEETQRRLLQDAYSAPGHIGADQPRFANDGDVIDPLYLRPRNAAPTRPLRAGARRDDPLEGRNTIMARLLFLWIMAGVLTLSVGFSVILGLCVAGLIMAFMIVPISAPFFLVGAVVAIGLFFLQRFIRTLHARASERSDWIRIRKQLRHA